MNNAIKQALKNRTGNELPSNFNYHMMNKIRLVADRQRKRRRIISWCWLIGASLSLVGFAMYILFGYLDVQLEYFVPDPKSIKPASDLFGFYWYIMLLVLVLLVLDFGIRYYLRKLMDK